MGIVWTTLFCAFAVYLICGLIYIATAPPSPYTEMAALIAKRQTEDWH